MKSYYPCIMVAMEMTLIEHQLSLSAISCIMKFYASVYSATDLESRKLFSFAKTIHLMCISILPSLDGVPYIIITKLLHY